ncbi:MAG: ABC transporter permease, partial [Anaerolineae bacterium]|nr:ABC transporter permease [Anaerolineae bacterium]
MRSFVQLYIATVREFTRDITALFWTLAFPLMFITIFGVIFSGDDSISFDIGIVNEDGEASTQLIEGFKQIEAFNITEDRRDDELHALEKGDRDAVIVIPAGTGAALDAYFASGAQDTLVDDGGPQAAALLDVYYDPANQTTSQVVLNVIDKVIARMNEEMTGVQPVIAYAPQSVQANDLRAIDYLLPGVLAMSLMQLGLFGTAGPLVSLREKGVLRRMGATPLSKSTLLSTQIAFRLTTALVQTVLIIIAGALMFNVQVELANIPQILGVVLLGATVFITLGYFISAFAKTEEAVQGLISLPNFIFMFLSGI